MKIDDLAELLIPSGEKLQMTQTKGSDVIKIACGYRFPNRIRKLVEAVAEITESKVELHSHIDGIPGYAIEKMISINGYTKFSW